MRMERVVSLFFKCTTDFRVTGARVMWPKRFLSNSAFFRLTGFVDLSFRLAEQ